MWRKFPGNEIVEPNCFTKLVWHHSSPVCPSHSTSFLDSNQEIKREVDEWKRRMTRPINLEQMPPDVQEIVEKHFKQREAKQVTNLVSVLRKPTGEPRKIHFSEYHIETQIQSDIPAKKRLRSCR